MKGTLWEVLLRASSSRPALLNTEAVRFMFLTTYYYGKQFHFKSSLGFLHVSNFKCHSRFWKIIYIFLYLVLCKPGSEMRCRPESLNHSELIRQSVVCILPHTLCKMVPVLPFAPNPPCKRFWKWRRQPGQKQLWKSPKTVNSFHPLSHDFKKISMVCSWAPIS